MNKLEKFYQNHLKSNITKKFIYIFIYLNIYFSDTSEMTLILMAIDIDLYIIKIILYINFIIINIKVTI